MNAMRMNAAVRARAAAFRGGAGVSGSGTNVQIARSCACWAPPGEWVRENGLDVGGPRIVFDVFDGHVGGGNWSGGGGGGGGSVIPKDRNGPEPEPEPEPEGPSHDGVVALAIVIVLTVAILWIYNVHKASDHILILGPDEPQPKN